jgi:SNF2 family DNA or RNA helicase
MTEKWEIGLLDHKQRIWLRFPYDKGVVETVKEKVPGARWDAQNKCWLFPLDMEVARDIRLVANSFGAKLDIQKNLADWARAEKARVANIIRPDDITADMSAMLPRVAAQRPALRAAMGDKPWQIPGAAFLVAQRNVLLADQPGLGKTIQTLAAVIELDIRGPILVVAPRTAVNVTWPEEIAQWLGPKESVTVINSTIKPEARRKAIQAAHLRAKNGTQREWVLIGPNYLRIRADLEEGTNRYVRDAKGQKIIRVVNEGIPDLFQIHWAAIIVDESHQTLAGATGNLKKQSAQRRGLGALKLAPNGIRIAMSGTPFRGKTENLWGTLNWLAPEKYTSYWKWIRRHYGVVDNYSPFGPAVVKGDKILDETRFFNELKPIMVRRTKNEVQKDLPPKTYGGTHLDPLDTNSPVAVWLPMSTRQAKQYNEIEKEAIITLNAMGDELTVNGVFAELIRCKQVANASVKRVDSESVGPAIPSNKIEWIIDFLQDRIEAGTKTIVASQFTQFIELLSAELDTAKINHYVFTGKTNDRERAWIKSEFQKDSGEMVILLNTHAGGVSLTLDAADDVVIADQTFIPDEQEQVEDRAHRVSRNHNVTIWNLASLGTIDETIAQMNQERGEAISSILDTQRGITYAKTLVSKLKAKRKAA